MTEYARGGMLNGPDPTPVFTETMFAQPAGYILTSAAVRAIGGPNADWLAKLNAATPDE